MMRPLLPAVLLAVLASGAGAQVADLVRSEVTAVVGAHTGPGVVGVALAPAPR